MIDFRRPITLPKVGIFENPIEHYIGRYRENLAIMPSVLGNTNQFGGIFKRDEKPYLLIIAQEKEREVGIMGFNTSMTISSYLPEVNEDVYGSFVYDTGISLEEEVPEVFKEGAGIWNKCFSQFADNPERAMAALRALSE